MRPDFTRSPIGSVRGRSGAGGSISCFFIVVVFFQLSFWRPNVAAQAFEIERSTTIDLQSEVLGRTYTLAIKLPKTYTTKVSKHYPVVYFTDSAYAFPLLSSLTRPLVGAGKIKESILVGISYAKEEAWQISRTRDYTPSHSPDEPIGYSKHSRLVSGGADKFIGFIRTELIPHIERNFRVKSGERMFIGHSLGGLLGAHIIKTKPNTFSSYVLSDPSLWYDGMVVLKNKTHVQEDRTKLSVLIVSTDPPSKNFSSSFNHNMARNAELLHQQLVQHYSNTTNITIDIYSHQIHETIFPLAVSRGLLRFLGIKPDHVRNISRSNRL